MLWFALCAYFYTVVSVKLPQYKKGSISNLRHLGKHRNGTEIFFFLCNDLRMFLMLSHLMRECCQILTAVVSYGSVPPVDQKELSKQVMNEEFKHQC